MEEAAFQRGYSLILCNSDGDLVKEKRYTEVLLNKQVDGIIFMATGDDLRSLEELVLRHLPVVIVDRFMDRVELDAVITDNFQKRITCNKSLDFSGASPNWDHTWFLEGISECSTDSRLSSGVS